MNENQWSRVKDLFHAALERDAEERSAFLATACGGDSALRAEVERLLAAHEHADGFIEQPPVMARPDRLTGRVIGRYEVGRLIGAGGMGRSTPAATSNCGARSH